jgi:hypothetical protein
MAGIGTAGHVQAPIGNAGKGEFLENERPNATWIAETMASSESFSRSSIAAMIGVDEGDIQFRLAFNDALNYLRTQGLDYAPERGLGGSYRIATDQRTLNRASRDKRAATRKLERGFRKLAIAAKSSDPHVADAARRRAESMQNMMVAMKTGGRRKIPSL